MDQDSLRVFALDADRPFAERVVGALGVALGAHEEREFEDGEHKTRPLVNVRGRDVFVIAGLYGDARQTANDKLCRLLFFLGALGDASARSLTAVVPYLCYARKDRKTKPRDPVTTRYLARLFEAVGTDRVVTLDVHNLAAFQNAYRCRTDHLEAATLFAAHLAPRLEAGRVAVVSPDAGGVKRAERFREILGAALGEVPPLAFLEKKRSSGVVSGDAVIGPVEGRTAVIIDDLISTGTTMRRAAAACRARGATGAYAVATHGLFTGDPGALLTDPAIDRTVVTDSVPPLRVPDGPARERLEVVDCAPLVAEAIRRIHGGGSLVELLAP